MSIKFSIFKIRQETDNSACSVNIPATRVTKKTETFEYVSQS